MCVWGAYRVDAGRWLGPPIKWATIEARAEGAGVEAAGAGEAFVLTAWEGVLGSESTVWLCSWCWVCARGAVCWIGGRSRTRRFARGACAPLLACVVEKVLGVCATWTAREGFLDSQSSVVLRAMFSWWATTFAGGVGPRCAARLCTCGSLGRAGASCCCVTLLCGVCGWCVVASWCFVCGRAGSGGDGDDGGGDDDADAAADDGRCGGATGLRRATCCAGVAAAGRRSSVCGPVECARPRASGARLRARDRAGLAGDAAAYCGAAGETPE